jgi:hypothetical protein
MTSECDLGHEETGTELVDRGDPVIRDREEIVLLEQSLARLRMDKLQPRAKVRDIADVVRVRVDELNSVEPVRATPPDPRVPRRRRSRL